MITFHPRTKALVYRDDHCCIEPWRLSIEVDGEPLPSTVARLGEHGTDPLYFTLVFPAKGLEWRVMVEERRKNHTSIILRSTLHNRSSRAIRLGKARLLVADQGIRLGADQRELVGLSVLKELYPLEGRLHGRSVAGWFARGERVSIPLKGPQALVLEILPERSVRLPALLGVPGRAALSDETLSIEGARGEPGSVAEVAAILPPGSSVRSLRINGKAWPGFDRHGQVVSTRIRFAGVPFAHCEAVGPYDPDFAGGAYRASFRVPTRVFDQLRARRNAWPIPYDQDDLLATWLGSDRLLLFAQIAEADDGSEVSLAIDGKPVEVRRAYGSIYPHVRERTFLGFYADVSWIEPERRYEVELRLPQLQPGQFQGLFFENVEAEYTEDVRP